MKQVSTCPSLFSRLYETNNAFREVGTLIKANGLYSFDGSDKSYDIISKCLDLLELIFLYGESFHLKVESIYFRELSERSDYDNIILSDYHFDKRLENNPCWLLFYWNNQILGGISPYTLVYTTPYIDISEINLMGTNGNLLFGEECVSLLKRGKEFQKYIISCIYHTEKAIYSQEFKEYFLLCKDYLDDKTKEEISLMSLENWRKISENLFPNEVCRYIYVANNPDQSDYQIDSTKKHSGQNAPLLLTPEGIQGAIYWREMPWNPGRMKIKSDLNPNITQRELPGTADIFPFLTTDDILEDKIIELTGITSPNKNDFFFLHVDGRIFLVPIKPIYFNYYTSNDLRNKINIKSSENVIDIQLIVPLSSFKYRYNIIKKSYGKNDIVVFDNFIFAMTPNKTFQNSFETKNICKIICSHPLNLIDSFKTPEATNSNIIQQGSGYVFLEADTSPDVVEIYGEKCSGLIVVNQERSVPVFNEMTFSVDCTTDDITIAYFINDNLPTVVDETEAVNTILAFDQDWKKNASVAILRRIESEFLPIFESNPPTLFSYPFDDYCQRIKWMIRNIAIAKAGTETYRLVIVHDTMASMHFRCQLESVWERGIYPLGKTGSGIDLVPSSVAFFNYAWGRYGGVASNATLIELGEEISTISNINLFSRDNIITKQGLFSTSFFWGIHNDYMFSSDFVNDIISKFTNINGQFNTYSNNEICSIKDMSETPYRFLLWLEKHSKDVSHFWEYIRRDDQVRLKALVYYVSILFYLNLLAKKEYIQLYGVLFFSGPGTEILHLLGNESILSKFSTVFLSEAMGSSVNLSVSIISSRDYKAIGGLNPINKQLQSEILISEDDTIDLKNAKSLKYSCVDDVQRLIDILGSKLMLRKIYDYFNIRLKHLNTIKELANDSFDYHIKDIFEKKASESYIFQEDLFFVSMMDFFSYTEKEGNSSDFRPILKEDKTSCSKNNKKKIFISYKREELNIVKEIKDALEMKTGYECWMDLENIESGSEFSEDIVRAINNTNIFLFMLSEQSQKSKFALKELSYAKRKEDRANKRFVVLVNIDGCEMNDIFSFKYGELDTIVYSDINQRNKLFGNIKMWLDE